MGDADATLLENAMQILASFPFLAGFPISTIGSPTESGYAEYDQEKDQNVESQHNFSPSLFVSV